MREDKVNRPEEGAMLRLLEQSGASAVGLILRLAWQAGLMREEITGLVWDQVDLELGELRLGDRTVPLTEELRAYLSGVRLERGASGGDRVVLSDRAGKPLTPQSISRMARNALDREGQDKVRLLDLRHDFIIRQLEEHDWQYVSRISGVQAVALNQHFAPSLPEKKLSTRVGEKRAAVDEVRLWKLITGEPGTPVGLALALTWQMGLTLEQIVGLTWEQVDLTKGSLRLEGADMPIPPGLLKALRELTRGEDSHVLLTPRSRRPFDAARLSRVVRAALVGAGLDDLTLHDLRLDHSFRLVGERAVLDYLKEHGTIMRRDVMHLLGVSKSAAYTRLKRMAEQGQIVAVGMKYYLAGAVVPPEEQREAILRYLSEEDFAYRQDIARLLHVEPRQCHTILKRLVDEGDICQEKQRYYRKEAAALKKQGGRFLA